MLFSLVFGQEDAKKTITDCRNNDVIVGKAIYLPKPIFPRGGNYKPLINTIIVSVKIDENGKVIEANAISGHPLFRQITVEAANISKFSQSIWGCKIKKAYTEISYTFNRNDFSISTQESPLKFIEIPLANLNDKAVYLPMPKYQAGNVRGAEKSVVGVQVKIDLQNGTVVEAKGISGHPLFRKIAEDVALLAKFDFTKSNLPAKYGKGVLLYKVADFIGFSDELIVEETPKKLGIISGRAQFLPKPIYPEEAKDFCASGKVEVEVLVDENGNVIKAKAISGNELLRESSVEAANQTKFSPSEFNVKIIGIIVNNFDSLAPKCIDLGIVNKKALSIPRPYFTAECQFTGEVIVAITIDLEGNVRSARAISGNRILRDAAEKSARKA